MLGSDESPNASAISPEPKSSVLLAADSCATEEASQQKAMEGSLQVRPTRATGVRFLVLSATAGFMFGNYYFFDQTSATEEAVEAHVHMSETTFGLLSSVYSYPNVILPLFGGMLIDIMGVRFAATCFTTLVLLGSLLFTLGLWINSSALLIVARVIFGMGGESQAVSALTVVTKWFRGQEQAFATAIIIAVSRLGSVATFDSQGPLVDHFGVTFASAVGSAICIVSLCCVFLVVILDWRSDRKDAARGLAAAEVDTDDAARCTDIKKFGGLYWLVSLSCVSVYVAAFPFMQVVSAPYLKERFGFAEASADSIVSNVNLTSAILSPILGLCVDRFGRRPMLLVFSSMAFVICHVGLLVFPSCYHCYSVLTFYIGMGAALSVYGSVVWPCIPLVVDENVVGTAFGLTTALQNLGMAISPQVLTVIHSATKSFSWSFIYIIICSVIGLCAGTTVWVLDNRRGGKLSLAAPPQN